MWDFSIVNLQEAWLDSTVLLPWQQEVHQHPTEVSTQVRGTHGTPPLITATHQAPADPGLGLGAQ